MGRGIYQGETAAAARAMTVAGPWRPHHIAGGDTGTGGARAGGGSWADAPDPRAMSAQR